MACAAIQNPSIIWRSDPPVEGYANEADLKLTNRKIRALFQLAKLHGHDSLVLGALGCGAFRNPSRAVATLFREAIDEYIYNFRCVSFAIYSIKDDNFDVFCEVFTEDGEA